MRCAQYTQSHRHSWWPPWLALLQILLVWMLQTHVANSTITCAPGIKSAGGTVPRGDIFLEYGGGVPLVITCLLDPDNEIVRQLSGNGTTAAVARPPSHRIAFFKNAERVPVRYVSVMNATAARLRIPDPPAGHDVFSCMLLLDDVQTNRDHNRTSGGGGGDDDDDEDDASVSSTAAAQTASDEDASASAADDKDGDDDDDKDGDDDDDKDGDDDDDKDGDDDDDKDSDDDDDDDKDSDDDDDEADDDADDNDEADDEDDAMAMAAITPTYSTVQPTSLETSGPPPMVTPESAIGVCLNSVAVGYKPLPITNFTCISDNWVSLTCNWTKPENPINTDYKLFFRLPGRAGGRTIIKCPTDSDKNENTCYWDFSTNPIYRQPYEYYYFTLIGENLLGNSSTPIRFHHYANVIPSSPINITVVDKTQSSAMLRWSVGTMTAFPRELVHKIEYKSQWDSNPEHWHSINVSDICNSSLASNQTASFSNLNCRERDTGYYHFNVTNLKYSFAHYDFRIYVRSSVARGEDKWSAPGCITLKTKPSIPRRPPRTDVGSFESVTSPSDKSTRDVFIYWQNIEDNEKGGDSFEYQAFYSVLSADNQTIVHRTNETYKNYAKFEGLRCNIGYNFTVYSANREGLSEEYSTIYVPSELDKLDEPLSFTKMAFDEQGIFELSWKNSSHRLSNSSQLSDYTIFWCENDKDRPYQCNGYMNWKHIPSTESCYNVTVSDHTKIYQFAISANSKTSQRNGITSRYHSTPSSSGMVWASCTVLHNKIVGKIKNVWVNIIGSMSMELRWKLDCSDRIGAVLGFRIFYCPVVSINNSACKEPMLNKTVSGEMAQDSRGIASVTSLKPYTTYMVTIALITKHGEGLHSDPLLNTTLEGAPDIQDLKIDVSNLTNTSVTLSWSPPKFTNGIVRYYYVHYYLDDALILQQQHDLIDSSDEQLTINEQRRITSHDTKCRIDHLESYRSYKITVTACTTLCSDQSFPIYVRTSVGMPGRIAQPNVLYENSTRIIVSWPRPSKPAGPVDYYQLVVAHHSGPTNSQNSNVDLTAPLALASTRIQENPNNFLYRSESNVFRVPVPDCNDEHDNGQQTFSFAVRAVNNNPNDPYKPFYGPWSTPGTVSCVLPGLPLALHLVIWSCLFIVLTTVSTYLGNRFWKKYKVMHNVKVVLPPTLNINFNFDQFGDDFDDVLDTSQPYVLEDGHIIYDAAPAADGVAYNNSINAIANANAVTSPAANRGRNNSCTASIGSDRLPPSRWSPATATTTLAPDDDDDEPSSVKRHQFVLPPSMPAVTSKNNGYSGGGGGGDCTAAPAVTPTPAAAAEVKPGDHEDPPPPTEPVLPFFTMPDMPPLPSMSTMLPVPTLSSMSSVPLPLPAPRIKLPCVQLPTFPGVNRGYQFGFGGGVVVTAVDAAARPDNRNRLCGGGVVVVTGPTTTPPVPAVDCFVGDQRQTDGEEDENEDDDCKNSAEDRDDGSESSRSPSPDDDVSSASSDEDPRELRDDDEPLRPPSCFSDPPQLQPEQPPQQRSRHDGYCGKHMMIAVAAAAAAAAAAATTVTDAGDSDQQQLPPQQLPAAVVAATPTSPTADDVAVDGPVSSAAAYVMLDMVTAQKRLLDRQAGRTSSDYVKPSAVVLPPPPPTPPPTSASDAISVGCGPVAAQNIVTDTNVGVAT